MSRSQFLLPVLTFLTGFHGWYICEAAPIELSVAQPTHASLQATLEHVHQAREQGADEPMIIVLPAGEYYFPETLILDSKLVGQGLTLRAAQDATVVFSGGIELTLNRRNEKELRYDLPDNWDTKTRPQSVCIDGTMTAPARYPNSGYLRIEKSLPDRRSGFQVNEQDLKQFGDLPESGYELILLHDWSSSRLPVASFDQTTRTLKTVGPIGCSADHYAIDHFEKQPRFWLEGHASFADHAGEWSLDVGTRQIVLRHDDPQTTPRVVLPFLHTILHASGTTDQPLTRLVLQGITFCHTAFPMPAGGYAGAQASMHEPRDVEGNRTTSHRPMINAAVFLETGRQCRVQNCRFEHLGNTGLWLGQQSQSCTIFRCQFRHLGGNGINLGEDNSRRVNRKTWYQSAPDQISTQNRIEQCEISHVGEILPGAVAIWVPLSRQIEIINNHIHDCPYSGISLGWLWNESPSPAGQNRISENRIQYVMQVLSDGGGIYTLGRQPESFIENNLITDIPLNAGRAESNGMFLDQGSAGFTIRNNTIRRIDRSPLRFHQAGLNLAIQNQWDLATAETPPLRFNNTPAVNIIVQENMILEPQQRIFLIGNSLTWDTIPSRLEQAVEWHVDCGKSLLYIQQHFEQPCVSSSRFWPLAFETVQYDYISFQPHYGTTVEEDFAVLKQWIDRQPEAKIIIHTGWAKHEFLQEEFADQDPSGMLTHSNAYFEELLRRLQEVYPQREFRCTWSFRILEQITQDITAGSAPLDSIEELYRDAIHMTTSAGRYLMHNRMRQLLDQAPSGEGFPDFDPKLKAYLDELLAKSWD